MLRAILFLFLLIPGILFSQKQLKKESVKLVPASWYIGLQNPEVELLVNYPGIAGYTAKLDAVGVELVKTEAAENADYLYLTLRISLEANSGKFPIVFQSGKKKLLANFELTNRDRSMQGASGVNTSDLIYMLMPDRFANGDPSNDIIAGTNEASINRDSMFWRHGGDIQGVINKIDYLNELGATAVWLTPAIENNQPKWSYHGYAITDHYRVDPRLGSNELYLKLVDKLHANGMKAIMDIVPNHIGNEHWLFKNLPSKDWINQWESFTQTTYRAPTLMDPYASAADKKRFSDGWFDYHMPDLNQRNPHVSKYLIQSYIWWVEYAGIDDFRIDTYAYSDQAFMASLSLALNKEYPKMRMFGEIWEHGVSVQSFFAEKFRNRGQFDSHLPGVLDFQIYTAINEALTKPFGWTDGVARIYYTLAKDMLYEHPLTNVTFLDNHDLSRFYSVIGEDIRKFKMGIAFLLTMRGIPSIYYGTEILMKGFSNPDGWVRMDFKGGWASDSTDKFTEKGRSSVENEGYNYLKKLANWRKNNVAAQQGKLIQFVPEKSVYVYFRKTESQIVMVVMNANDTAMEIKGVRFDEILAGKRTGRNVISEETEQLENIVLKPWEVKVIEL